MKELIKKLRNNRIEVTDDEWNRLSSLLDKNRQFDSSKSRRSLRRPLAIAASLLVLIGFGLWMLNDPEPAATDSAAIVPLEEELNDRPQIALAEVNRLSHRGEMVSRDMPEPSGYSDGAKPYKAILPNGENWLIHMELNRERENCEATIKSINDKAMQWQLDIVDDECSEFSSGTADASVKFTTSNGEEKIILELRDQAPATQEKPLSLELRRIY
ncbi:MAG: hypothetical protein EA411_00910 [Saprospirales bacterium]|nr:MAG: hypothetical protein EA411_00910 [Saprospirales bacterium]